MMKQQTIIIGSRGSKLALWQSNWVKSELERKFSKLDIRIEIIKTTGDKILDSPLSKIGDKGLFTKEIEHALLEQRIDLAVHSLKDLPTELPAGLTIGCVTEREDVRDVFIAHPRKNYKNIMEIPVKAAIGTGSLRRKSQLLNWRNDIRIVDLRGNIDSRLAKLDASDWDGIVLASAGLKRLGLGDRITEILPTEMMLPAVGQGALGIEIRNNDNEVKEFLDILSSETTMIATRGERALLRFLEGGCQIPIGTHGRIEQNTFYLDAMVGSLDGKQIVRGKTHGAPEQSEDLGKQLAKTLLANGAREILRVIRSTAPSETPES